MIKGFKQLVKIPVQKGLVIPARINVSSDGSVDIDFWGIQVHYVIGVDIVPFVNGTKKGVKDMPEYKMIQRIMDLTEKMICLDLVILEEVAMTI